MKLLLDENLPRRFKQEFPGHEVSTVRENGWSGKQNGELLQLMIDNGFDALVTMDQNLHHQQNLTKYSISVILLKSRSNKYTSLLPFVPAIEAALKALKPGVTIVGR